MKDQKDISSVYKELDFFLTEIASKYHVSGLDMGFYFLFRYFEILKKSKLPHDDIIQMTSDQLNDFERDWPKDEKEKI